MDAHEAEYHRLVREALLAWKQQTDASFREWLLETVKTLAILNSAGLAGVAAIFASNGAAEKMLGNYPSGAFFALGLMAAGFDMYFNARGFLARHDEIFSRIKSMDRGVLAARPAIDLPTTGGEIWFKAAAGAGWTSAAMFIAGAWPFIKPALCQISRWL